MAVGFRKSLMGFNTSDVLKYIEETHKNHAETKAELSSKLENLQTEFDALQREKSIIEEKLSEYEKKHEEIERLSENIGKLYLVAKSNAQAIMKNSAESSKLAYDETNRNISAIENAQKSLDEIKNNLLETTSDFSAKFSELLASLDDTRSKITENGEDTSSRTEDFDSIYELLNK